MNRIFARLSFRSSMRLALASFLILWMPCLASPAMAEAPAWRVGVAKIDITPEVPMRLSGYSARTVPFVGIDDRLSARALVLSPTRVESDLASKSDSKSTGPDADALVIVSIDAIGISAVMTERIVGRVSSELGIERSRIVLCTTHSHTAPHLDGVIPNLFGAPLSPVEQAASESYTRSLEDRIVDMIREAAARRVPGTVEYGVGRSEFAINRRMLQERKWIGFGSVDDGPVDRTVRVLKIQDASGAMLAVAYQYACHCTSISPEVNRLSGDWAGLSAAALESSIPGCIALPIIGCGADANPNPRGTTENAQTHGAAMAESVRACLAQTMSPLPHPTQSAFTLVALASERPTKAKLEEMQSSGSSHERNFAKTWLEVLSHKDRIPESYPAPIHFWSFGDELAWIFMSGEVVVDYQMRFERELSQFKNVWVAGYVDDVFAYVASERVRNEGGYEVDGSMLYYGQPGRWVSGTEDAIVDRVLQMTRQEHPADQPMTPEQSLASIEVPEGWTIELVACEPLVVDPINIAFGPDGTVWVVEMGDYPSGGPRTGCVKTLHDRDGDGQLDSSTLFLDGLDYPAGVYPWRDGAIIACAPDVFFARDTDGDGVADERVPLLTGFPEGNPQHRVYGFTYGMEHRLYFGTGGSAEQVTVTDRGIAPLTKALGERMTNPSELRVAGHDLSLDPDRGDVMLETGDTQFIRSTDDFAHWFGNENSIPMFHFVVDQRWLQQSAQAPRRRAQLLMTPPTVPPVYPISMQADRFNDLFTVNRFTSACSAIVNRGPGQGAAMLGNAIVCEPVHNLVARFALEPRGATWAAVRSPQDAQSDWIRSRDPWFRPVRVENAPDGTLWIVDMYRYVIEHPEWIPEEWQRRINVRAGDDRGRIYRVRRNDFQPKPILDRTRTSDGDLIVQLLGDNSSLADSAQQLLVWRAEDQSLESSTIARLKESAEQAEEARSRLRAFATLVAMKQADASDVRARLHDLDPRVVEAAVRWLHRFEDAAMLRDLLWESIRPELLERSASLALSVAIEASHAPHPNPKRIAETLAMNASDPWVIECAVLLAPNVIEGVVDGMLVVTSENATDVSQGPLLARWIPLASDEARKRWLGTVLDASSQRPAWHYLLARQLSASGESLPTDARSERIFDDARSALELADSPIATRRAAMELLDSRMGGNWGYDHELFLKVLQAGSGGELDRELSQRLVRLGTEPTAHVIAAWQQLSLDARNAALAEVANRSDRTSLLLDSIATAQLTRDDIDAATVQRLRQLPEGLESKRVSEIFGPAPLADRAALVRATLAQWPSDVDVALGKQAYEKHCSVCHEPPPSSDSVVGSLGPNLRGLAPWTNEAWMSAILNPNQSVEEKYWAFQARTQDGEALTGLILREDANAYEWVSTAGRIDRILKTDIAEMKTTRSSLMPEGFEQLVTPEQLAGIITYLRSPIASASD